MKGCILAWQAQSVQPAWCYRVPTPLSMCLSRTRVEICLVQELGGKAPFLHKRSALVTYGRGLRPASPRAVMRPRNVSLNPEVTPQDLESPYNPNKVYGACLSLQGSWQLQTST
eukprot:4575645-Amphidinium_carterae.2